MFGRFNEIRFVVLVGPNNKLNSRCTDALNNGKQSTDKTFTQPFTHKHTL